MATPRPLRSGIRSRAVLGRDDVVALSPAPGFGAPVADGFGATDGRRLPGLAGRRAGGARRTDGAWSGRVAAALTCPPPQRGRPGRSVRRAPPARRPARPGSRRTSPRSRRPPARRTRAGTAPPRRRAPARAAADPRSQRSRGCHGRVRRSWNTMSPMRASERQRASGQPRPAWPGNAMTVTAAPSRVSTRPPVRTGPPRLPSDHVRDRCPATPSPNWWTGPSTSRHLAAALGRILIVLIVAALGLLFVTRRMVADNPMPPADSPERGPQPS